MVSSRCQHLLLRVLKVTILAFAGLTITTVLFDRHASAQKRPVYSDFSHSTHVVNQKLACNSCHKVPTSNWREVRKGDDAFPDVTEFPQHASCLDCHRQQFFARERPAPKVCSNCHLKGTPADTSRSPFPSLGEKFLATPRAANFSSEFRVLFPHDKHSDADCTDCHQTYQAQDKSDDEYVTKPPAKLGDGYWLKKGTFKTRPITHAICFTCHNQESDLAPLPANCESCHKLPANESVPRDSADASIATMGVTDWWARTAWRNRSSAATFRHEMHPDIKCTQCHNLNSLNTTRDSTRKVAVKACGGAEGCHVTQTLDDGGILNYEIDQRKQNAKFVCTKCHLDFGSKPVPASHLEAIPKASARVNFAHASPQTSTDFSQFKHDNRNHSRLPCLLCHRRENNSAQPVLPGKAAHAPCTGCHQQQFADSGSAICRICHTDTQTGALKPFPPLRSFNVRFDHSAHDDASCATCHKRNRNGVAFSIPARQNAHVTCFGCHTPSAKSGERDISSCSTCHQLGQLVRASQQAPAFRVGFTHANHDQSEKLTCNACHQVRAGWTRVSAPLPLNHHAPRGAMSCASCHNGKRAFGGDDFSTCKRCHQGTQWRF